MIRSEREQAAIKSYHDFANGGAKKQDALLSARAQDMAAEEMKKQLDNEAFNDLFGGDDKKMESSQSVPNTPKVRRVPDGKGGYRERYVDYFNAQVSPTKQSKRSTPAKFNLLDDSD